MKINISGEIGFCFGVRRAIKLVEENIGKMKKPVKIYGHLAHNKEVVKKINSLGIKITNNPKELKKGTLIITAHGISPIIKKEFRKNLELFDTTCPMVAIVHKEVKKLREEKRGVLIFGDPHHREVKGIMGASQNKCYVFSSQEDFLKIKIDKEKKYGLVSQTTQDLKEFEEIKRIAEKRIDDIKVINTICEVTRKRQKEVEKIAKKSDIVLIIGSKNSANTNRLFKISSFFNKNSYLIEDEKELKKEWFKKSIGITAGASTPDSVIKKVIKKIND